MRARPRRRRRAAPRRRLRRWLRRQDHFTRVLLVAVLALSTLVVALIVPRLNEGGAGRRTVGKPAPVARVRDTRTRPATTARTRSSKSAAVPEAPVVAKAPSAAVRTTKAVASPAPAVKPRAAIVIDDLGQRLSSLEELMSLDIPLTIAVIPGLPASERTVSEASRRGIEMLLHQPMEPHAEGGKNAGDNVLLTSMSAEALRALVRAGIAEVPGAVGVNNHMGSKFTEDAAGLAALMAEIREHGLFWLDSRTTPATRGVEVARTMGVPSVERDIFLDAEVNADFIRRQVKRLLEMARKHGTAVGIGHPHPETIAVLRELRKELLASDVALVRVSSLVHAVPDGSVPPAIAAARADQANRR